VNTLYTNTIVTRANQLWICGFANASSQLLFSRNFLQLDVWKKLISWEQRKEAQDRLIFQGHETVLFSLKLYGFPQCEIIFNVLLLIQCFLLTTFMRVCGHNGPSLKY